MFSINPRMPKLAETSLRKDEVAVVPFLSYDLRDLDVMRRNGQPISVANAAGLYYDGEVTDTINVPLERQRGVDINDVWNATMTGRRKASKAGVRQVDLSNLKTD